MRQSLYARMQEKQLMYRVLERVMMLFLKRMALYQQKIGSVLATQ